MGAVECAGRALAAGHVVVVVDPTPGRNESSLVFAAQHADTTRVAFTIRHTSGLLGVAMTADRANRLRVPMMTAAAGERTGAAFTVSVDATTGVSTGISAADRARTIRLLAAPDTAPTDLTRPGHVLGVVVGADGVLDSRGEAEAAHDLVRLAGTAPVAAFATLVSDRDPRRNAGPEEAAEFAARHGLCVVVVDDLVAHRRRTEMGVRRVAAARMPLRPRVVSPRAS